MPFQCNNQCCRFHGAEVGEDLRGLCAKLSSCGKCSATEVPPVLPIVAPGSASPGTGNRKLVPAILAAVGLGVVLLVAWRGGDQKQKQGNNGEGGSGGSTGTTQLIQPIDPKPAPQVNRDEVRRDLDALVVTGNRMVKMHRALVIAREEADAAVSAQDNRTEIKRSALEVSERAKQIHRDGSLFERAAREKEEEIRDETQTYLKTLDRLVKVDDGEVDGEMAAVAGGLGGVADKRIALDLAKRHLGETRRYGGLDHMKIFQDYQQASTR